MPEHDDEGFAERERGRVFHLDRELEFYSVAQRHKRGLSTREWLVEEMIPRRAVVILSGWSSVGKTHIVNDLMYSCAFGEPFAGYQVMRRCGSLMFAAEGQDDVRPRWNVLDHAKIKPWQAQHREPFDYSQIISWTEQIPRLDAADAFVAYCGKIDRLNGLQRQLCGQGYPGLGLVAIDTMTAAADLNDDQHNAAGSNQKIFNMLHALAAKYDCAVVVTDHLGKDAAKGTRGSSAKEASADVVLQVTGTVNDDGICSNTAMTIKKLRGGVANKRITFSLADVRMPLDEEGRRQDGVVVKWDVASSLLRGGKGPAKQAQRLPDAGDRCGPAGEPAQCRAVGAHCQGYELPRGRRADSSRPVQTVRPSERPGRGQASGERPQELPARHVGQFVVQRDRAKTPGRR
jgi:hypothetical protein